MRIYDIIANKRDGLENTKEELTYFIKNYVAENIPHEQVSAWLMAVYFQGMTPKETAYLTEIMMGSGHILDLSGIHDIVVDKHSTGGVGDKTTLIVAPIVAAAGVPMAKMSGRGLGFTGGTIDKLEAIPGFKTDLSTDQFIQQVNEIGLAIVAQNTQLVPADKKLYALRDITATVESIPLIASSIMSKKLATGAAKIVLDVKYGSGAFMKTLQEAKVLAKTMVDIGKNLGRDTVAIISKMDQPLGYSVGNALEVIEAIEILKGGGEADLIQLSTQLAGEIIFLAGKSKTSQQGVQLAKELLDNKKAYEKLLALVEKQGGDTSYLVEENRLLQAKNSVDVFSQEGGIIHHIDAAKIGQFSMNLGAGRLRKEDAIDLSAGIILKKKVGQEIKKGELLATLYYGPNNRNQADQVIKDFSTAYLIKNENYKEEDLIADIIS